MLLEIQFCGNTNQPTSLKTPKYRTTFLHTNQLLLRSFIHLFVAHRLRNHLFQTLLPYDSEAAENQLFFVGAFGSNE